MALWPPPICTVIIRIYLGIFHFLFYTFWIWNLWIPRSKDGWFLIHKVGYWVYSPLNPTISSVRVLQFNMYLLCSGCISPLDSGYFSPLGSGCFSPLGSGCISSGFRMYLFLGFRMYLLCVQDVSLLGLGFISSEFRMYLLWVQGVSPLFSGRISSGFRIYLLWV